MSRRIAAVAALAFISYGLCTALPVPAAEVNDSTIQKLVVDKMSFGNLMPCIEFRTGITNKLTDTVTALQKLGILDVNEFSKKFDVQFARRPPEIRTIKEQDNEFCVVGYDASTASVTVVHQREIPNVPQSSRNLVFVKIGFAFTELYRKIIQNIPKTEIKEPYEVAYRIFVGAKPV